MVSNKTTATLLLIILNMRLADSTSNGTQRLDSSGKSAPLRKKYWRAFKSKDPISVSQDTISAVKAVEVHGGSIEAMSILREQPTHQVNGFEELIKQGEYKKILGLSRKMNPDEFMNQLASVVKTVEQYNGILSGLKDRGMVAKFYLYGNIGIIKNAIIESGVYNQKNYVKNGDLEAALPLAFKEDHHGRIIGLLKMRQEISVEEEEKDKQSGHRTRFESFVGMFLFHLAPWEDDMPLRRFLASCGEELREKHPDILDTLCQELMPSLRSRAGEPKTKKLITDLIGQPLLLTPVTLTKRFLPYASEEFHSNFIECAWDEAVREGLTSGGVSDRNELWQTMTKVRPKDFIGAFPSTPDALAAVLRRFPTKQKLGEDWHSKTVMILYNKLSSLGSIISFPTVLLFIISEYAVSLTVTENSTTATK